MTQKALIVKYLNERGVGVWVKGYELVKYASGNEYIIQDADTRAYEVVKEGFESEKYRYTVEHRKQGKYAEFRIYRKEAKNASWGTVERQEGIPSFDLQATLKAMDLYAKEIGL